MLSFFRPLALAVAAGLAVAVPSTPQTIVSRSVKQIAPGVLLTQTLQSNPPLIIDVLTLDAGTSSIVVSPEVANDSLTNGTGDIRKGRETVAAYVSRTGVTAAVNGDYFPFTGDPLGLGISNGELYSEPYRADDGAGRAAIGWLPSGRVIVGIPAMQARLVAADGTALPITGINRLTSTADSTDVCLVTPRFGPTSGARGLGTELVFDNASPFPIQVGKPITATLAQASSGTTTPADVPSDGFVVTLPAGSPLASTALTHFHSGDKATVSVDIVDTTPATIGALGGSWNRVRQAIGGGPILLRGGRIVVDDEAEHLGGAFSAAPHARTAVGQRQDGKLLILTVDAGSSLSSGVTLATLAAMMQQLGAIDAINLDGGSSTTMAVAGGMIVDYPSGAAYERPVADLLAVRETERVHSARSPAPPTTMFSISGVPAEPVIGQTYPLAITSSNGMRSADDKSVIWSGPVGSCGFVSQDGVLRIIAVSHGTITARYAGQNVSQAIDVPAPLPTTPTIHPLAPAVTQPATSSPANTRSVPASRSADTTKGSGTQQDR